MRRLKIQAYSWIAGRSDVLTGVAAIGDLSGIVATDDVAIGVAGAVVTGVTGARGVTEARGTAAAAAISCITGSLLVSWVRGLCWVKSQ
jgi:hypothetical protein